MLADGCQPGKKKRPMNSWLTLYFEVVTNTEKVLNLFIHLKFVLGFPSCIMIYTYEIA